MTSEATPKPGSGAPSRHEAERESYPTPADGGGSSAADPQALRRADLAHYLHPVTLLKAHEEAGPRIMVRGEGIHVTDIAGRRYIDGLAGLWCVAIGHGRRRLAEAAARQMEALAYAPTFFGYATPPTIQLAEQLARIAPAPLTRATFTSGGSEANEANIKIARAYWELKGRPTRKTIIGRQSSYHGVTYGALSATGLPNYQQLFGPMVPGFRHIPPPHRYRCAFCADRPACTLACADALEAAIEEEGPENVAAFIGEPLQAAGIVIPPPEGYWARIQEICRKHEILLIVDEVITGFGRTGSMFGCETYGIRPDLMSLAKGIISAYLPLGAAMVSEEVYRTLADRAPQGLPFLHGVTYSGHPVAAAVALENLRIVEEERLVEHARRVGAHFQRRLRELARNRLVGDARGQALIGAIEVVRDRTTRAPFPPEQAVGSQVADRAYELGVICRNTNDVIAFAPPLIITEPEIDRMFDVVARALDDVATRV